MLSGPDNSRFHREVLSPAVRRVLPSVVLTALLVALERWIPAALGLRIEARGTLWLVVVGAVGALVLAVRHQIRRRAGHRFRGEFVSRFANAVSRFPELAGVSTRADRIQGIFYWAVQSASRFAVDVSPGVLGNCLALVTLLPVFALTAPSPAVLGVSVLGLFAVGIAYVGIRVIGKKLRARTLEASRAFLDAVSILLRGHHDIVAAGTAPQAARQTSAAGSEWSAALCREERLSLLAGRLPGAAMVLGSMIVAWFVLGPQNRQSAFQGLSDVLLLGSVVAAGVALGGLLVDLHDSTRELRSLSELLDTSVREVQSGTLRDLDPSAAIAFRGVSFSYPESSQSKRVLENLDFCWKPGEVLAITGANGCGKSTVLRLLLRFYDPEVGSIQIGSQETREFDLDAWRSCFAYLPQKPFLLETSTIRNALRMTAPNSTDEDMSKALDEVGLGYLASNTTDPLDIAVAHLSSGERQRVALARVVCSPAPNVVLDEPDAFLDANGLETLLALINSKKLGKRVLVVAHHPAVLERVSRVIRLGPLTELGEKKRTAA